MRAHGFASVVLCLLGMAFPAVAQSVDGGRLDLELNRLQATDQGCEIALLAQSSLESDLRSIEVELVLFDTEGVMVDRTLVGLAPLDAGRTVLRPFLLPEIPCGDVDRVLLNGFVACDETFVDDAGYCDVPTVTSSRAAVDFIY